MNGATEIENIYLFPAPLRCKGVEERHQQVFGKGINDVLKLSAHHNGNGLVESVPFCEEEIPEFTYPALKHGPQICDSRGMLRGDFWEVSFC